MLDSFGRRHTYLRLAVTDRCNLRCSYCMPRCGFSFIPPAELLTADEITRLVTLLAAHGIRKVRLTGGEPTLREDLTSLARAIRNIPGIETLALTTNGVKLGELARPLREAGVQYINISFDSLRRERFADITGVDALPQVLAGVAAAFAAGFAPVKLNVVVMGGINDDELEDFVELGRRQPLNIRFIEFMPFLGNSWNPSKLVPYRELLARLQAAYDLRPTGAPAGSIAKDYHIDGFAGNVSFITPLSDDFCTDCSRLRITADGLLKTCLFSSPAVSLRDAMRQGATDAQLEQLVRSALRFKQAAHPPAELLHSTTCQAMSEIGG